MLAVSDQSFVDHTKRLVLAAVTIIGALVSNPASSALIVPLGLQPGDMYHLMFTTQGRIGVNKSDIDVYNAFVNDQAALSDLTEDAIWFAIVSTTSVDARDNALVEAPVYRIDGILLASDFADMWDGSLAAAPNLTQFNGQSGNSYFRSQAFTGSNQSGFAATGIRGPLGSVDESITLGSSTRSNGLWINKPFLAVEYHSTLRGYTLSVKN